MRTSRANQTLLDLELPLSISFGSAILPLKDVLALGRGAVIELDRESRDPVEISVNDIVIAEGDVVAVDGHYGVRITKVYNQDLLDGQAAPATAEIDRPEEDANA